MEECVHVACGGLIVPVPEGSHINVCGDTHGQAQQA